MLISLGSHSECYNKGPVYYKSHVISFTYLIRVLGLRAEVIEHTKVLIQSITIDRALPALDWGAVLCPLLHSDTCGEFDGQFVYIST